MRFLLNLFRPNNLPSLTNNDLTLNERNRIREEKELALEEAKKAKARKEREKADRDYKAHVAKVYPEWIEEFQYVIHKGSDGSKFEMDSNGELTGVFCIGNNTLKISTKLDHANRSTTATRATITIDSEYMEAPMTFRPNIVRNTSLVNSNPPVPFANTVLEAVNKKLDLIHMRRVVSEREERKRLKREELERNRQRNLAKRKGKGRDEELLFLSFFPKSELG